MAEICHRTSSTWIGYKKIYFSNKDTNLSIRAIFLSLTFICSSWNFHFLLSSLTSNNKSTNSSCLLRLHTLWCYFSSRTFFSRFTCTFCTTHYTTPFPTLRTQFKGAILGSSTITAVISEWNSILRRLFPDFLLNVRIFHCRILWRQLLNLWVFFFDANSASNYQGLNQVRSPGLLYLHKTVQISIHLNENTKLSCRPTWFN